VLITQCMGYTKSLSVSSTSELKAFDKIFDDNLTASNVEALDMLFSDGGKGSSRQALLCRCCVNFLCRSI